MNNFLSLRHVKISALIIIGSMLGAPVKAQYITIPDTAFVSWLQNNGFAACMAGNQLDTASMAVTNATSLFCNEIFVSDLTGIQYFKNLDTLDFSYSSVHSIPSFPARLTYLNCQYNNIESLPALPTTLVTLICNYNQLTSLPVLPPSLITLDCCNNQLGSLPALPAALRGLYCYYNQINHLPELPQTLIYLTCDNNYLTILPVLPPVLQYLTCGFNQLGSLPALPATLIELYCAKNQLSHLPELPLQLKYLYFYNNQVNSLPDLPGSITILDCSDNKITTLPVLPDSLNYLNCSNNFNLSCLPQVKTIVTLYFDSTAIACAPDYGTVTNSSPPLNSLPLCGTTSLTCPSFTDITPGNTDNELALTLYPNPAKNYVIIESGQSAIGGFVQVTDVTGREVLNAQILNVKTQISTSAFPGGMYYVKVSTAIAAGSNERTAVRKLVVE